MNMLKSVFDITFLSLLSKSSTSEKELKSIQKNFIRKILWQKKSAIENL